MARLLHILETLVRWSVAALAVLSALLVVWGVVDVAITMVQRLRQPPVLLFGVADLVETFGAFLAVLVAVEIFANLQIVLKEERLAVELVIATALVALARKVIVLDYDKVSAAHLFATAALVASLAFGYLISRRHKPQ